jgi:hypothetical protein
MNNITRIYSFFLAVFFVVATVNAVAVPTADAWGCRGLTATPNEVFAGEEVKLTWNAPHADIAYVTVDKLPGQQFARDGFAIVKPTQTTTYTAHMHKEGRTDTLTCSTKVTVKVPPAHPECTLEVDKTSLPAEGGPVVLTWTTKNADSATFNNGIGAVALQGNRTETVTQNTNYILTVHGAGGTVQCKKSVVVAHKPPEEPTPDHCPFVPKAGRTIIDFTPNQVRSDKGQSDAETASKSVTLPAGSYVVNLASWDGYNGRAADTQSSEQWKLVLKNGATTVATSNASADLADGVREASVQTKVNDALVVSQAVTSAFGLHNAYPDTSSSNGHRPLCAALDEIIEEVPAPECTLEGTPTTLPIGGGDVALTWTTKYADTVSINEGVGSVEKNGSKTVTTTTSKTYTLTATGKGGTKTCPVSVTVPNTPDPLTCSDVTFTASDTSVREGDNVTLSWSYGDRVTSASIDQGIGAVTNNGNRVVEINDDITFNITIKNATSERSCPVSIQADNGGGGGGSSSPKCELKISDKSIKAGESVKITWNTSRATEVTLIDSFKKVLLDTDDYKSSERSDYYDGSITVKPTKDTTYTLTASKGSKERTCKVSVDVTNSAVTVTEERNQPLVAGISLSQVPYTGFEAGPTLTIIFYILLALWSAFVAYLLVIRRDSLAGVSLPGAFTPGTYTDLSTDTDVSAELPPAAARFAAAIAAPVAPTIPSNLPTAESSATPVIGYQAVYEQALTEEEQEMSELENRAHAQKALLSSDAMRYLIHTERSLEARAQKLDAVVRVAKVTFPTEDGWIVLNLARMEALLGDLTEGEAVAVETDVTPTTSGSLAEALVTGNVVAAFAMITNRPMVALADAVSDLDAIYRARKGERVAVSEMLEAESAKITSVQLEKAIVALTSAIDGTYTDEAEAVKMAIMKAIKELA